MDINERFKTIIQVLFNGNKRAFAKAVGISPTVVENVVGSRKGKPSYDVLVKVCSNANISAEWLLLGIGDFVMDMFTVRKNLTLTAPCILEDGTQSEIQTVFKASKAPKPPKRERTDDSPIVAHLTSMLTDKDDTIGALHEEIGRLKAKIEQLERREVKKTPVAYADTPDFAPSLVADSDAP